MPKISIIIPLYNKAPYVMKALGSVKAQTFTDWECIIIDDGSSDGGADIVKGFTVHDSRFKIICQQNAGVSAARNRGIRESDRESEYIAFLDADDWWEPTFLDEMVRFAEEYPDAGLWASNYIYYKPGKTRVGVKNLDTGYINYPKAYYENGEQVVWTGATIISRLQIADCKLENGEYFQRGIKLGEDFLLWSRIALKCPVAFLNKPLAYYNNEVPANLRLTRNLHAPETHMLWNLQEIDDCRLQIADCELRDDWKRLLDKLRVGGLLDYWLDDRYHDMAAVELMKVNSPLPKVYAQPIGWVRAKRNVMKIGSFIKQKIRR